MELFPLLGIIGMCFVLTAFLLINAHRLTADSLLYDVLNLVGSTFLVISAWEAHVWSFVILNGVFVLYSLRDIVLEDVRTPHKIIRKA